MKRGALVEQNRVSGEEKRISQSLTDISFERERPAEQEAGRRAVQRAESSASDGKKRRKLSRIVQQTAEEAVWASTPEPTEPNTPIPDIPSMRMAADAPMLATVPVIEPEPPPLPDRRKRSKKLGRKAKKRRAAKHSADAVRVSATEKAEACKSRRAGDTPLRIRADKPRDTHSARRKLRTVEDGGRLRFDEDKSSNVSGCNTKNVQKKAKQRHFTQFASEIEVPAKPPAELESVSKQYSLDTDFPKRLRFDTEENDPQPSEPVTEETQKAYAQRQAVRFASNAVKSRQTASDAGTNRNANTPSVESSINSTDSQAELNAHLYSYTKNYKSAEQAVTPDEPAARASPQAPPPEPISGRLRFEDEPPNAAAPSGMEESLLSRQQRRYEKAEKRVEKAEKRLEQARERLPKKRRLSIEKEVDSETGKIRRRLHFEQEIRPEYGKPSLPTRAGGLVKSAAVMKLHSKIHESERQNVSVEAAHKSELLAEQGAGRFLRWSRTRRRSQPYRALRHAERHAAKEKANLAWQTALRDHPELQKQHTLAKWMQKQQIKRKYAQAAHETKQAAQLTQNVLTSTGQIVRAAAQQIAARKSMLLIVALLALIVMFFSAGMTSCTAMLSGIQSSYISTAYMANEEDICDADLYYTEMEVDLQLDINKTEESYPGYDEYRYNIGEISHNPYELLGYLSTKFNAFTFDEIRGEIEQLFSEQYTLTREAVTETREDDAGNPYEVSVLQTTLTAKPLFDVIGNHLAAGEESDRYGVYMQTLGNRQAFGNPFDLAWLGNVTSGYGYRVHPTTGEKDLHRGIDIAAAQGTEIRAIQDGFVTSAGDSGSYGLCVTIADDQVYESRYAHCSSLAVSAGQEVKRGDVIAAVGSTGESTGPHLHLEVLLNGEYLNPYFFVDAGDDGTGGGAIPGTPGGPEIPDYSGSPVGDGTFAAMLEEAEKYLGWPYVWGGSAPATSFDCSGFVCWVLNQSGAMSIERTTATGIYNRCTVIPKSEAQPGDLIFFTRTYSSPGPISHIGIYVGDGKFIHCGNPISYASVNNSYWQEHFYAYARIP